MQEEQKVHGHYKYIYVVEYLIYDSNFMSGFSVLRKHVLVVNFAYYYWQY